MLTLRGTVLNDNSLPQFAVNTSLVGNSHNSSQPVVNFTSRQDRLSPKGVGNNKQRGKLLAQTSEGGDPRSQTCSFEAISNNTLSRALSQATGLNVQDSPIKSVNTITEPLHISENGLSRLLQSMDMTQASNPNALRKRSKSNSSSGRAKFAAG